MLSWQDTAELNPNDITTIADFNHVPAIYVFRCNVKQFSWHENDLLFIHNICASGCID